MYNYFIEQGNMPAGKQSRYKLNQIEQYLRDDIVKNEHLPLFGSPVKWGTQPHSVYVKAHFSHRLKINESHIDLHFLRDSYFLG